MGADKDQGYLLRIRPGDRQRVMAATVAALKRADPARVITHTRAYDEIRSDYFQDNRAMAGILVGVIAAVLLVNGTGIVGLASFWVG